MGTKAKFAVTNGLRHWGPFDSANDASNWAVKSLDNVGGWSIIRLKPITKPDREEDEPS